MIRLLLLLVSLLAAGCSTPPPEPVQDVLSHHGAPAEAEDWSFVPFADQGAWFGFGLPPDDRPDLRGGFTGPFLMTNGRWISPQLLRLTLGDAFSLDEATDVRSASFPGWLRQTTTVDGLRVTQELWFDSSATAFVRVRLYNTGSSARRLDLAWTGSVFHEQATLESTDAGVTARSQDGTSVRVDADRPTSAATLRDGHYVLPLAQAIQAPPGAAVSVAARLTLSLEGDATARTLPDFDASLAQNRVRWNRYLAAVDTGRPPDDPVQLLATKSLLTLVNNWRAPAGRMRYSSLFPSSNVSYFNGFWAWDSWKHAVALVTFDHELAKDQVRVMFDHQDETGMVADVVYLDPAEDNWRDTKPPLAGWAVETVYQATGDLDFARQLYPKLVAYHEFWYADRDHDRDGLCEYGSTDGTIVAARWESGMDNAVRFDDTEMLQNGPKAWSMNQESVDLNSYLYREKHALRRLARDLALHEDENRWREEADRLRVRIQETMFDEESGWFYDIDIESGAFMKVQGPEGWIPLWTEVATEDQAARVRKTMIDPEKFRTHVPFPTVAKDDPGFSDGYWRGLVWLDQAYFAIEGLRRYGYHEDAAALTQQLFANLEGATVPGVALRENYHPLTGEGRNVKHFSWTAAHLLLLALEAE